MLMHLFLILVALVTPSPAQPMGPWLEEAPPPEPVELDEGDTGDTASTCDSQILRNGVQLPHNPELYRRYWPDTAWGTPEMIEAITAAAEEMAWLLPDADPIIVGDISTRHGGHLSGHKSHRGGIDADIGLYWKGGRQYKGFTTKSADELDAQATWLLIRSLLDTGHVERILLDRSLIDVLRRHVVKTGQLTREEAFRIFPDESMRSQLWKMEGVVQHTPGHRDHIHLRVKCPE